MATYGDVVYNQPFVRILRVNTQPIVNVNLSALNFAADITFTISVNPRANAHLYVYRLVDGVLVAGPINSTSLQSVHLLKINANTLATATDYIVRIDADVTGNMNSSELEITTT